MNDKIEWNKTGRFVLFKNKKFYPPYKCFCCGMIIEEEQFCFGRLCPLCDVGECQKNGVYQKGHGRKDIFENAEDMGDEFQEIVKEKLRKTKREVINNNATSFKNDSNILNPNCSEVIWRLKVKFDTKVEILKALEDEDDEDYETFETNGDEYQNGCVKDMIGEMKGGIDIDESKIIYEENQGREGVKEYTERCFKIAKSFIKGEIDMNKADKLEKSAWEEEVEGYLDKD